jgi:hypothetical protein
MWYTVRQSVLIHGNPTTTEHLLAMDLLVALWDEPLELSLGILERCYFTIEQNTIIVVRIHLWWSI